MEKNVTKHDLYVSFRVLAVYIMCYGWMFPVWLATSLLYALKDSDDLIAKAELEIWSYVLYMIAIIWIAILWWISLPEGINAR